MTEPAHRAAYLMIQVVVDLALNIQGHWGMSQQDNWIGGSVTVAAD